MGYDLKQQASGGIDGPALWDFILVSDSWVLLSVATVLHAHIFVHIPKRKLKRWADIGSKTRPGLSRVALLFVVCLLCCRSLPAVGLRGIASFIFHLCNMS